MNKKNFLKKKKRLKKLKNSKKQIYYQGIQCY